MFRTKKLLFFSKFSVISFRVDEDRIKEVGPDRACAEWLLRCGAAVRYCGFAKWNDDYNLLPVGPKDKFLIEQVDATGSCIMHIGFPYFGKYAVAAPASTF